MTHEILFAGFGGQGVLSMGSTLAYASLIAGKEVTWYPSYGPEMRGGTANCIVIVADKRISSPIVSKFDALVAMNQPSVDKFEKSVKPNGILIYDIGNIVVPPTRTDITIAPVDIESEVLKLNNLKVRNMIMLGAFLSICQVVNIGAVVKVLPKVFPERYHHMLKINQEALERGEKLVIETITPQA